MRKRLSLILLVAIVAVTWSAWPATYYGTVLDQRAFGYLNGFRVVGHKPEARWHQGLARCAHNLAVRMRDRRRIFHDARCSYGQVADQTVGMDATLHDVNEGFWDAKSHRAAIVGRYKYAGTGVARDEDTYYVVYNFGR